MATDNRVRVESWTVQSSDQKAHPSGTKVVTKVTVRHSDGTFNGATNFRGSFLSGK